LSKYTQCRFGFITPRGEPVRSPCRGRGLNHKLLIQI
jgi:hypothetical protein